MFPNVERRSIQAALDTLEIENSSNLERATSSRNDMPGTPDFYEYLVLPRGSTPDGQDSDI